MHTPRSKISAFTIVELLVVIAVISLLMALILPALSGVQKRTAKNTEMSNLRQVNTAWSMYGSNNNDAALPGYLSIAVQAPRVANVSAGWGVKYDYPTPPAAQSPDKTIPPAPNYNAGNPNIAGPWTWRLMSYLGHNHNMVHGYRDEEDESIIAMVEEAQEVAEEPAYGYNGYYIGGYWDQQVAIDNIQTYFHRYYNHCGVADSRRLTIPLGLGQIRNSSKMVAFCSSSLFETVGLQGKPTSETAGSHLVMPPYMEQQQRWRPDQGDPTVAYIEAVDTYAPIGRYTGQAAVLWADGHCDSQGANALDDQRQWINSANAKNYTHQVCP